MRYKYHPVYHWYTSSDTYVTAKGPIHINKLGLRGRDLIQRKPEGTLRVLCLGGSSTFNYHASQGRTWPMLLEQYLRTALKQDVEVINAGTPGYSLYQSSVRFEHELINYDPDVVLVYHLWNDLKLFWMDNPADMISKWEVHGRFNEASTLLEPFPLLDNMSRVSQFVTHLRFAWISNMKKRRRADDEGWFHLKLDKRITGPGVEFYRSNLQRVARVAADHNLPLGLIDQAMIVVEDPAATQNSKIRYNYLGFDHPTVLEAVRRARAVTREVAMADNVSIITTDGFPKDFEHFRDHVHLNEAGLAKLVALIGPQIVALVESKVASRQRHVSQ
jgi:lysophospholipase L1-like esterase